LAQADGHLGAAAARLSLTRHALRHQMLKLGIQTPPADA
jgi:DNA-binding transcriptional LysR family regulator